MQSCLMSPLLERTNLAVLSNKGDMMSCISDVKGQKCPFANTFLRSSTWK